MAKKIGSLKLYLIIGFIVAVFLPPFAKYQELKYKNKKLEQDIVNLKLETARLAEEKRLLETDINYVEKVARDKIGIVRKGEIVMKGVPVNKVRK